MTIRENIFLALKDRQHNKHEILSLTKELEIFNLLDRYPRETSLGQRQRAALIRAVAVKPKYLLLDEPTSALDDTTCEKVLRLLNALKKSGTGLLIATHHSQEVLSRSLKPEQILQLREGRLMPFKMINGLAIDHTDKVQHSLVLSEGR